MREHYRHIFTGNQLESVDLIKWLRMQGERSRAWDFFGSPGRLEVMIYDEKIELAYQLKYEWAE